jgi:hypothetical protein
VPAGLWPARTGAPVAAARSPPPHPRPIGPGYDVVGTSGRGGPCAFGREAVAPVAHRLRINAHGGHHSRYGPALREAFDDQHTTTRCGSGIPVHVHSRLGNRVAGFAATTSLPSIGRTTSIATTPRRSRYPCRTSKTQCVAPNSNLTSSRFETSRLLCVSFGLTHCHLNGRENPLIHRLRDVEAHEAPSGLRQAERVPGSEHDVLG